MKLKTTLAIIRKHDPCADGWKKLLKHIGPDYPENGHIHFATILESNGLQDALWGLRAVLPEHEQDRDRLARLFACDCAEKALHIFEQQNPDDKRPREAIQAARDFATGKISAAASAAASTAASTAARDAASAAARAAARDAARDAASAAARAAASAAASTAARDAARDAAWAAARAAARDAASAAAWDAQKQLFIRYFCTNETTD